MKFSIKEFSSKCDHIHSILLKKPLMEILSTEGILTGKLHFLCSVRFSNQGNLGEKKLWRKHV